MFVSGNVTLPSAHALLLHSLSVLEKKTERSLHPPTPAREGGGGAGAGRDEEEVIKNSATLVPFSRALSDRPSPKSAC